ncbi:MAG TPA: methyl-accepting chemotaxis protein [Anaeromyxobacteraceae bacterium]|nr:methyl-accepting chemotaxis protein [Anaeromyxobacteraceae bacterium]
MGRGELPKSLFAKATALLVAVIVVVATAAGAFFSRQLAADSHGELDRRGRALLGLLERHQDLRLALTLRDGEAARRVLAEVLESDGDARYLAALGPEGEVLAAAWRGQDDAAAAVAGELPRHALDGGEPRSDRSLRRLTRELSASTGSEEALALPGEGEAAPARAGHLVLGLDATRVANRALAQTAKTVTAVGLVLLAVFLLFFWSVARRATRMAAFAERLAARDLSARLDDPARDELGRVADALLTLRQSTETVVRQLREASGSLRAASDEVLSSAEAQLAVAESQAASAAETGSVVNRVRDASRSALERAQGVVTLAQTSDASAREGSAAVEQAVAAIVSLRAQADSTAATVVELVERTTQIADIMQVLRDIAEQSGVLSLNASIEAARAGEAGRGFAIVAGEVRQLAERSRAATTQVQRILGEIHRAARASLAVVEESRNRAQGASGLASASGEAIRRLATAIGESSSAATMITQVARAQGEAVDRIWEAMQDVSRATRESATGIAQLREASRSIGTHADQMERIVETYRLDPS